MKKLCLLLLLVPAVAAAEPRASDFRAVGNRPFYEQGPSIDEIVARLDRVEKAVAVLNNARVVVPVRTREERIYIQQATPSVPVPAPTVPVWLPPVRSQPMLPPIYKPIGSPYMAAPRPYSPAGPAYPAQPMRSVFEPAGPANCKG